MNEKERYDAALAKAKQQGLIGMNTTDSLLSVELMEFTAEWLADNKDSIIEDTRTALLRKNSCVK
jgi:hypothetical protein